MRKMMVQKRMLLEKAVSSSVHFWASSSLLGVKSWA